VQSINTAPTAPLSDLFTLFPEKTVLLMVHCPWGSLTKQRQRGGKTNPAGKHDMIFT